MKRICVSTFALFFCCLVPQSFAGDGVTVIFKSGQVVFIEYGYQKVVDQVKSRANGSKANGGFLELSINGGTFLLSLDEIAVVCRDDCRNLVVSHQQDPSRAKN
jgi:hypothetical protein